ncbi:hypothetical protein JCM10213_007314 [Rhodosporidiobolus nylandii]
MPSAAPTVEELTEQRDDLSAFHLERAIDEIEQSPALEPLVSGWTYSRADLAQEYLELYRVLRGSPREGSEGPRARLNEVVAEFTESLAEERDAKRDRREGTQWKELLERKNKLEEDLIHAQGVAVAEAEIQTKLAHVQSLRRENSVLYALMDHFHRQARGPLPRNAGPADLQRQHNALVYFKLCGSSQTGKDDKYLTGRGRARLAAVQAFYHPPQRPPPAPPSSSTPSSSRAAPNAGATHSGHAQPSQSRRHSRPSRPSGRSAPVNGMQPLQEEDEDALGKGLLSRRQRAVYTRAAAAGMGW